MVSLDFYSRPFRDTQAHTHLLLLIQLTFSNLICILKVKHIVAWNSIFKSWSSAILSTVAQRVVNSHAWSFTNWHANFLELCYDVFNFIGP